MRLPKVLASLRACRREAKWLVPCQTPAIYTPKGILLLMVGIVHYLITANIMIEHFFRCLYGVQYILPHGKLWEV